MTQTFFLGLGGQKCGSSWIQAYLARQEGSDFGRLGEYQIWEHHLGGVFARYAAPEPTQIEKLRARAKRAIGAPEPKAHLRWRLQTDPEAYFRYFEERLQKQGVCRTGDITPSYAALSAKCLAQIVDEFGKRGIAVKVIFAMRDPVDRLRSHLRMEMAKGRWPKDPDNEAPLRRFYRDQEAAARSRYDQTLAQIDQVFERDQIHICLFEDMFTPKGIAGLAGFAQVPIDSDAGAQAVNARAKGGDISEELTAEIARHYAPVYAAVAQKLPQISDLWPSAKYGLTTA